MIEWSKSAPLTIHVVVCPYYHPYYSYSEFLPDITMGDMLRKLSRRIRELSFTLLDGADCIYLNWFALFMSWLSEGRDDDAGLFQLENLTIHSVPQSSSGALNPHQYFAPWHIPFTQSLTTWYGPSLRISIACQGSHQFEYHSDTNP